MLITFTIIDCSAVTGLGHERWGDDIVAVLYKKAYNELGIFMLEIHNYVNAEMENPPKEVKH
uniref:Uncharacterized protein n=1 Tax=Heterorhabditis bacteriophora TaxID=37862 RepID=A0A1I7XSP3_HETBA